MPHAWDVEADVVVVGFGAAGFAASVTAHDLGAKVVILEKAPEGQEGGNTRVAGPGLSQHLVGRQGRRLSDARCAAPTPCRSRWCRSGPRRCAATTTGSPSLGGDPQEHQHQPVGIEFPDLPGSDCVHKFHDGPTYGYSYTWKLFERLVKERPIPILYETPGRELIQHDITKEILGVRAQRGERSIYVKARKGVVLTCGGFENNQEMIRNYLPGVPYCYTSGSPYNEGDGITMAMSVGADLWHMNNYAGPSMALKVPEVRTTFSMQALHFSKQMPGGMIVVGPDARRFCRREVQDPPWQGAGQRALAAAVDAVPDVHDLRPRAVLGRAALRQAPEPWLDADHRALRLERGQQRRAGEGLDQDRRQPAGARRGRWGSTRRRWRIRSRAGTATATQGTTRNSAAR